MSRTVSCPECGRPTVEGRLRSVETPHGHLTFCPNCAPWRWSP